MYSQQTGLGAYRNVGNWEWEFYPPPYDFLAPRNSAPQPAPIIYTSPRRGLGGCGCAGTCGGCSGSHAHGVGDLDLSSLTAAASSLFSSTATIAGMEVPYWVIGLGVVGTIGLLKGLGPASSTRRRRHA